MRLALLLLCLPISAGTLIQDTISPGVSGGNASVTLTITNDRWVHSDGSVTPAGTVVRTFADGAVSLDLAPTDDVVQPVPALYSVRVTTAGGQPATEYWLVKTTGSVLTLPDVQMVCRPMGSITVCAPPASLGAFAGGGGSVITPPTVIIATVPITISSGSATAAFGFTSAAAVVTMTDSAGNPVFLPFTRTATGVTVYSTTPFTGTLKVMATSADGVAAIARTFNLSSGGTATLAHPFNSVSVAVDCYNSSGPLDLPFTTGSTAVVIYAPVGFALAGTCNLVKTP